MDKFWMVLKNDVSSYSNYRHDSLDSAQKEATRLALKHPGTEFIILESLGHVAKQETVWIEHVDNEIPF